MRWLFLPGIWLQSITTKQPDDSMIEVAIASMQEALAANGDTAPEGSWDPEREPIPDAGELAEDDGGTADGAPRRADATQPTASHRRDRGGRMSLEARLDELERRLAEIEAEWSRPEVAADPERSRSLGREQAQIAPIVDNYRRLRAGPRAARRGPPRPRGREPTPELRELAREVVAELEAEEAGLVEAHPRRSCCRATRTTSATSSSRSAPAPAARRPPSSRPTCSACTSATRSGAAGGPSRSRRQRDRASGACARSSSRSAGEGAYSRLKYEGGVHRVQRVPETESSGRIHTSTATVAVLPEGRRGRCPHRRGQGPAHRRQALVGPGGQSVNTTDSAVRITHLPTGLVVEIQDEKSQHKNKAKAMAVLRARLLELEQRKAHEAEAAARRSMVGSGERSEKIRTYNFPQDRITDHRIGMDVHDLPGVLDGDLDRLIDALITTDQAAAPGRRSTAASRPAAQARRPAMAPTRTSVRAGPRRRPAARDGPRRDRATATARLHGAAAPRAPASMPSCCWATSSAWSAVRLAAYPEAPSGRRAGRAFAGARRSSRERRARGLHPRPQGVLRSSRSSSTAACSSRAPRPRRSSSSALERIRGDLTSAPTRPAMREPIPRLGRGHRQRRDRGRARPSSCAGGATATPCASTSQRRLRRGHRGGDR